MVSPNLKRFLQPNNPACASLEWEFLLFFHQHLSLSLPPWLTSSQEEDSCEEMTSLGMRSCPEAWRGTNNGSTVHIDTLEHRKQVNAFLSASPWNLYFQFTSWIFLNLIHAESFLRSWYSLSWSRNSLCFKEPEDSLPCSQAPLSVRILRQMSLVHTLTYCTVYSRSIFKLILPSMPRSSKWTALTGVSFIFDVFQAVGLLVPLGVRISAGRVTGRSAWLFRLRDSAINGTLKYNHIAFGIYSISDTAFFLFPVFICSLQSAQKV
jgi:hypothetical protein